MKFILGLGKVLTVAFWGVVLFNQLMPQPLPFNLLINAAGIVLFSGSLYALALGAPRPVAWVTPIGGVAFLGGWALLAVAALRGR